MREIAKKAGCSHTTIYLYYTDKESLLEQIAAPILEKLYQELQNTIASSRASSLDTLKELGRQLFSFGLQHRHLYVLYFLIKAEQVDKEPEHKINYFRNKLFHLLTQAVYHALEKSDQESHTSAVINHARLFFYQVHGTIMTYIHSDEPPQSINARVLPLLEQGIEALIKGLEQD